ncbi:LuxR C-terminal-related transcriptional regulator [Kitasatospora sp. NPDC101235]|uniref:helix-turn-helix transcriptional regulator n=1 Tax=Kitasatospora sp. NPDC101235 TaxID=3364101 RepID=UPI003801EFF7
MYSPEGAGFSEAAADAYRVLVQRGAVTAAELSGALGAAPHELDPAIGELTVVGLVESDDGRLVALSPRVALDGLVESRAKELDALRDSAEQLARFWRDHHAEGAGYLEVLKTRAAREASAQRLYDMATEQVRALTIGYVEPAAPLAAPAIADGFAGALKRGVRCSVVYGAQVLGDARGWEAVRTSIELGEHARAFPGVPLNLGICDDRFAVVSAPARGSNSRHNIVVQRSDLLYGLIDLFESFWQMAVPLSARGGPGSEAGPGPTTEARQLLTYLSGGLTDAAIARELGVSERTVARRITRLQEVLGARTRFQLGIQATRRGWI